MLEYIYKEEINMKSELDIMELKLTVLDKIREGLKREWREEDELDRVGYMNFYMGMKYAIEFILNESEFYEY